MTPRAKTSEIKAFLSATKRAESLYELLVEQGGYCKDDTWRQLKQPERRDIAEGIFFEIAARFEAFARFSFQYAVCRRFRLDGTKAFRVMGTLDRGIQGTFGWAAPQKIEERGKSLFGVTGFFGRFAVRVGKKIRDDLKDAHLLRNRIAHEGAARKEFIALLGRIGVPHSAHGWASVGRLLMDYPTAATKRKRLFFRILKSYRRYAEQFKKYG
jgi:hypothetical protein